MMMRAAAPPTAIPAMAPVESPELCESPVEAPDVEVGEPDGSADDVELGGKKAMALVSSLERTAWMRWSFGQPVPHGTLAQQPRKGGSLSTERSVSLSRDEGTRAGKIGLTSTCVPDLFASIVIAALFGDVGVFVG